MSAKIDAAWLAGMQAVNDEAAGLLNVNVIDSRLGAELLGLAVLGDREALALLRAVGQVGDQIRRAPRNKPSLCICCPRPVRRISSATVFGVAVPATANIRHAVGFVFCPECGDDRSAALEKAGEGLRRIWPDLRPVRVTHPGGGRA